jgi:hypothetical protein
MGLYRASSQNIGFATQGAQQMRLSSSALTVTPRLKILDTTDGTLTDGSFVSSGGGRVEGKFYVGTELWVGQNTFQATVSTFSTFGQRFRFNTSTAAQSFTSTFRSYNLVQMTDETTGVSVHGMFALVIGRLSTTEYSATLIPLTNVTIDGSTTAYAQSVGVGTTDFTIVLGTIPRTFTLQFNAVGASLTLAIDTLYANNIRWTSVRTHPGFNLT